MNTRPINRPALPADPAPPSPGAVIRHLPIGAGDEALVKALRDGHPHAPGALYDRHAPYLRRVLARTLGVDHELDDALQETFVRALAGVGRVSDPARLRAWLTSVAVFTARGIIRRRGRRRWLLLASPQRLAEHRAPRASSDDQEALRATYAILEGLGANERIAFALRFIEGMKLGEVAEACACSLATVKRRIRRAEETFIAHARRHPVLALWLENGHRWGDR